MKVKSNRVQERSKLESILKVVHDYAYAETLIIVSLYLFIGYLIDSTDVCIINGQTSYILILLAIITLFHGFENGMIAVAIISFSMWFFYDTFQYVEFLSTLMMSMIFSEFHYYWTKKIKEAEVDSNYRGAKLEELSKAFYALKISHDQLEKNYIIKPMSIRNSIEHIITKHREIYDNEEIKDKSHEYYVNFLGLLEKSFNVHSAIIIHLKDDMNDELLTEETANVVLGTDVLKVDTKDIFKDYLVDKAIGRKTAIYISDKTGEPAISVDRNSEYLAAIPAIQENKVVAVLIVRRMPFMAFNRENLTSISILLEYFLIEIRNKNLLNSSDEIAIIPDEQFRFEYARLKHVYNKYKVNSIILVLRIDNELQATRIYEKIVKMLRSLDMAAIVNQDNLYYITLMFPLHDKSAALGYLNRLLNFLDEEKDREFNHMTFGLDKTDLFNKYLREDYGR